MARALAAEADAARAREEKRRALKSAGRDAALKVLVAVAGVDGDFSPQGQRMVQPFRHHIDDDHARTQGPPDQQHRKPNAARAMHGQPLARLQGRPPCQRVPRGRDAAAKPCSQRGRQAVGQARKVMGMRHADIFGISPRLAEARHALGLADVGIARLAVGTLPAGKDERGNDPVPDRPPRQRPRLDHLAAIFMAGDGPRFHARMFAHPAMPIAATDATGKSFQHHAISFANRATSRSPRGRCTASSTCTASAPSST